MMFAEGHLVKLATLQVGSAHRGESVQAPASDQSAPSQEKGSCMPARNLWIVLRFLLVVGVLVASMPGLPVAGQALPKDAKTAPTPTTTATPGATATPGTTDTKTKSVVAAPDK